MNDREERDALQAKKSPGPMRAISVASWRRGSLTVEAAWAVPLFFLCVAALVCMMNIYGRIAVQITTLQVRAEKAGMAAGVLGPDTDAFIDLPVPVTYEVRLFPYVHPTLTARCRARVRPWTGRDPKTTNASGADAEDELVLVTAHASVYHTDADCTHLALSVRPVSGQAVGKLRNEDGGKYHACEKCVGKSAKHSVVYITREGDRYHNSETCSGLTRTTRLIPKSEVSGLHECSRCLAKQKAASGS